MKYIVVFVLLIYSVPLLANKNKIDSLIQLNKTDISDSLKIKNLASIAFLYYDNNQELGIKYGNEALEKAKKINSDYLIAHSYTSLGLNYWAKSNNVKALEYFFLSNQIFEKIQNFKNASMVLSNIGMVYEKQEDFPKAIKYYKQALTYFDENDDKNSEFYKKNSVNIYANMGNVYINTGEFTKAIKYLQYALDIHLESNNEKGMSRQYGNLGLAYSSLQQNDKAIEYLEKAAKLNEKLSRVYGLAINQINLASLYTNIVFNEDSTSNINENNNKLISDFKSRQNILKSIHYSKSALQYFKSINNIQITAVCYELLSKNYTYLDSFKIALNYFKKHSDIKDTLNKNEVKKKIEAMDIKRENILKDREIAEINFKLLVLIFASICFIIFIIIIIKQHKKSEKLLLNILPKSIAKRLKSNEKNIADEINSATIIFLDISNFTEYSNNKNPKEIVKMLNEVYSKIDQIADKYGLEKIKTIGDSYMAASGVPVENKNHAINAAHFALNVLQMITKYQTEEGNSINVRIGIDCGKIVAGVIGKNKMAYDIWGDTVNTASRLESFGTINKIHISENFKLELNDMFITSELIQVNIKGKGIISTCFLEDFISENQTIN